MRLCLLKMLPEVIVLFIVICVVSCQIDGEFWWLHNDITKFKHGTAPPPKFDDVNELDTDETAKIIFKDDMSPNGLKSNLNKNGKSLNNEQTVGAIYFRDETELSKPYDQIDHVTVNNEHWKGLMSNMNNETRNEDEFQFIFPSDDNSLWTDNKNLSKEKITFPPQSNVQNINKNILMDKIMSQNTIVSNDKDPLRPESICSFIEKSECIRNEGTLHTPWLQPDAQVTLFNKQIICCILPIKKTSSKIVFLDGDFLSKRNKRSTDDVSSALKQRNTLMTRKYNLENQRMRTTTPGIRKKLTTQKVVNSDDYSVDPYWNIKNSNIRNPDLPIYQDPDTGYDYAGQSYGDDYAVELPQPGLLGIYSDHRQTQTNWMHNKNKGFSYDTSDSVEEEFETSFGYSSIDPRLDHRSTSKPFRRRPLKLTAASQSDPMDSSQSQTISFNSNPDFHVMQGFKLLNLKRHKNRFVRKIPPASENCDNNGLKIKNKPSKFVNYFDDDYEEDVFGANLKQKLFNECGKPSKVSDGHCENDREQGVVEFGAHPWILMVISTKSQQNILCYATLVHARVSVTAAECVDGKEPGEISIIAGVRKLAEDIEHSQRRMASVVLNLDYTSGDIMHNLALLHWKRPLILDATVQPACLAELHSGDSCLFVGWGGYDQKMLSDLHWQRASVLTSQNCNKRLSKLKVDALCAAVKSKGTVTGIGGPLLCKRNDRWSAVGVAVWRDDVIVLLPIQEWVTRNMATLQIQ